MSKKLEKYNQKRNFNNTKEPIGKERKNNKKLRFVVQHHIARKDHYDLRLEWNGVLKSWAVPKGPSYNVKEKRLAVMVEDHPLDYRNFDGTIPKGEYGGGTVMVWDNGYFKPQGDFSAGLKKGIVKFELNDNRLKGSWTLVHFKANNWLLIKESDNVKIYDDINRFNTSIKTGRTMEEISLGKKSEKNIFKEEENYKEIEITSPNKVIVTKPKVTKLDIVNYYKKVGKRMMPYLEKRLISTIRCPSGNKGTCFLKKHLEGNNKGVGKILIPNNKTKKDDYYYIKNITGIINEVQMNGYEFHIWGCKVSNLDNPDMMVFDLDPDEKMNLKNVREGVKDLKCILDSFSLKSFLKTSGGKGYHVVVPIKSIHKWDEFSSIAKNIAKLMEAKWPKKYVSNMRKDKRKGKIFIDWVRNTKSSTSVAPYSLRIRKNATVSMPIKWSELDKVKPNEITMDIAIKRLKRKDPWDGFFDVEQ